MRVILAFLLGVLGLACAQQCSPQQWTCDNGNCIPANYRCDGDNDCRDWSDETDCPDCSGHVCDGRCIVDRRMCDGIRDCEDASDERDCQCDGFLCPETFRCINPNYVCDGDNDCGDWYDERECPDCGGIECGEHRVCIPARRICDGTSDCEDGSDERWEPGMPGFGCADGRCVPDSRVCDGDDDCGDGSDETELLCPCANEDDLRCGKPPGSNVPGPCIPEEWVCDEDGIWDCPDGSDEANCTLTEKRPHARPSVLALRRKRTKATIPRRRQDAVSKLMKIVKAAKMEKERVKRKDTYGYKHLQPNKQE